MDFSFSPSPAAGVGLRAAYLFFSRGAARMLTAAGCSSVGWSECISCGLAGTLLFRSKRLSQALSRLCVRQRRPRRPAKPRLRKPAPKKRSRCTHPTCGTRVDAFCVWVCGYVHDGCDCVCVCVRGLCGGEKVHQKNVIPRIKY